MSSFRDTVARLTKHTLTSQLAEVMCAQIRQLQAKCSADAELYHHYPHWFDDETGRLRGSSHAGGAPGNEPPEITPFDDVLLGEMDGYQERHNAPFGDDFNRTAMGGFISNAFDDLALLLHARREGDVKGIEKYIFVAGERLREFQEISKKDKCFTDCLICFQHACTVAMTELPRQSWVEVAANRQQALGSAPSV